MLGLGTGTAGKSHSGLLVAGVSFYALMAGQSLISQLRDLFSGAGDAAFSDEAGEHFLDVTLQNKGVSGSHLTKTSAIADSEVNHWWDDQTSSKGTFYTAHIDPIANKEKYLAMNWAQGTADWGTSTPKALYKTALQEFFAQIKTDFPNITIFLSPLHRRTNGTTEAEYQAIREAQLETIDEIAYVQYGADHYAEPLIDATHLTQAGQESFGVNMALRNASGLGEKSGEALGPALSNLQLKTDVLEFAVNLDTGADDFTAPTEISNLRFESDGAPVSIDSVSRVDSTSGKIVLGEGEGPLAGSVNKFFTHWGFGAALNTSAPGVLKDNSAQARPVRQQILTVQNADPIQAFDNLAFYMDPRASAKTYSSGSNISSIAKLAGAAAAADVVTPLVEEPVYDASAFDGAGGVSIPDNSTQLLYGPFTAGATHSIGFAVEIPASAPDGSAIFGFANSGGGVDNQAKLGLSTGGTGRIAWSLDQDSFTKAWEAGFISSGARLLILLELVSASVARLYINDWSAPATLVGGGTDFDPRDDFISWTYMSLFERSLDSPTGLALGGFFHTLDLLTSGERTSAQSHLSERFSVS